MEGFVLAVAGGTGRGAAPEGVLVGCLELGAVCGAWGLLGRATVVLARGRRCRCSGRRTRALRGRFKRCSGAIKKP